ncbi:formyl-coenzyme A transferase NAD(P)-binding [Pseudorhizobium banfieldiae]|uniref:Formyl-coenzyme A transferase NAD(P)-binding n=1 Tax=Pseudorhizobium banfieldiae TaxID=1125847 RepID=L0NDP6_9HYPH|nr:CaiB/BaiF CoA-transferase family protein [Pseudorhizobium banfieldiae]CAD6602401.1 CoA transferase [arsenite-oxidising bacterium NT-25]CAD6606986.1 CoA transferase [Rhizobium sp. TCK]CCF18442.1 formyl-coenzyme A transferase NAD(P)-binding [Pseudorhizobium banfieldiae]
MAGPLDGLLVVSLEQAVAAPFCTSRLADAGARVIKVERPEGDFARNYDRLAKGHSSYFVWLNRGKQSIALDLKQAEDLAVLKAMLAKADVFVENLAPGAVGRLGLSVDVLEGLNPTLVQCHISGYGDHGPHRDRKAYDLLIQAESGLASVTGTPEEAARVGISVCDIGTGMYAHAAILEALIERRSSGRGAVIEVAMFDAMADWMAVPLLQAEGAGRNPPRMGLRHPSIAPYGVFTCADGRGVLISIQNEREWHSFCGAVMANGSLATDPRFSDAFRRIENRAVMDGLIETVFAAESHETMIDRLDAAGIAYAMVNTPLNLAEHPHLRRIDVATEGGTVSVPAPPARRRDKAPALGPVPSIDTDGAAIRREFG